MQFKIYLSQDQWAKICEKSDDVAAAIAAQQPELAERLGIRIEQPPPVVTRKGGQPNAAQAAKPAAKPDGK